MLLFRSIFNWAWKVLQDSFVFLHCFVMWLVQETHVTFSTNQWWLGNSLSLPFRQFAWFYFEFSLATCDIFLPMIGCFMYVEFAFTSPNWKAFYLLVSLPSFTLLCFTLPSFCYSFFTLHTISFASLYALWRKCVPFTLSQPIRCKTIITPNHAFTFFRLFMCVYLSPWDSYFSSYWLL